MNDVLCCISTDNYSVVLSECICSNNIIRDKLFYSLSITKECNENSSGYFMADLRSMNQLKSRSINSLLFNILPYYDYKQGSAAAYTQYYEGDLLCKDINPKEFISSLSVIFHGLFECSMLADKVVSIPPQSVLIEKDNPNRLHFLFIDFSCKSNADIASLLENHLASYGTDYYPVCFDAVMSMTEVLRSNSFIPELWERLSLECIKILKIISENEPFFIGRVPNPVSLTKHTDEIRNAFLERRGMLVLYSEDTIQALQEALGYAQKYTSSYENIAVGDAASGVNNMLQSQSFSTNKNDIKTGVSRDELISICQKNALLIIKNYSFAQEDNDFLIKLYKADIIIIADASSFRSEQELIDYGLTYLLI